MESKQMNNSPNEDAVIEALTSSYEVDIIGTKTYRNKEGKLHRIYGPAFINTAGTTAWFKNGKLHREDGPAEIYADGREYYYINGEGLTKDEFIQWQKDNGIKPIE